MELNWEGVVVGAASLLVIGAFHPLVIWCEYRFTQRVWPVLLIAGLLCLLTALLIQGILSILLGLRGAGCRHHDGYHCCGQHHHRQENKHDAEE